MSHHREASRTMDTPLETLNIALHTAESIYKRCKVQKSSNLIHRMSELHLTLGFKDHWVEPPLSILRWYIQQPSSQRDKQRPLRSSHHSQDQQVPENPCGHAAFSFFSATKQEAIQQQNQFTKLRISI